MTGMEYVAFGALGVAVISIIISLVLLSKLNSLKKRFVDFTGGNGEVNLEENILEYRKRVEAVDEKYSTLKSSVERLNEDINKCVKKVGVVRYNPFDEMGGNLCFTAALLDGEDDGIVLNGIHSRTGSFTYAKPVEAGVSTYVLSEEEQKAIDKARENYSKN